MQDAYVGDIGDFGKYGLLRLIGYNRLKLSINWYYVIPSTQGKQNDGKYIEYLSRPNEYRTYDTELFDGLCKLVLHDSDRKLKRIETSCLLNATYYSKPLQNNRHLWHTNALLDTQNADIVFLDPDNGLETATMHQNNSATFKHVKWDELKDYYNRGQSVILYQHRPKMTSKTTCIQNIMKYHANYLKSDHLYILEFPKFTNRFYFFFTHNSHVSQVRDVCRYMDIHWKGLCRQL